MAKRAMLVTVFAMILSLSFSNSKAFAASTVYFCLEASCSSMTVVFGGVTHTSKLNCNNVLSFSNVPAGTYSYSVAGCGLSGSGSISVNGVSSYKITMCPSSGWPCCPLGCDTGGAYKCSACKGTTTTTTTTATTTTFATTSTSPTTTLPSTSGALVVQDSSLTKTFTVDEDGLVFTARSYNAQGDSPGFWLDETGSGKKGAYFVLDENWMQVQRRKQNFGSYEASPVFINVAAPHSTLVIADTGYVGFGMWGPLFPLHMASGAYCTAGGVWTNASSKEYKTDIKKLTAEKAVETLTQLDPVEFAYKADPDERHVGFIAEDAPGLVATKDRKGMSPMDVVAVLTKVVQEQQNLIGEQKDALRKQEETISHLTEKLIEIEGKLQLRTGDVAETDN